MLRDISLIGALLFCPAQKRADAPSLLARELIELGWQVDNPPEVIG
jgi:hypothetical protein